MLIKNFSINYSPIKSIVKINFIYKAKKCVCLSALVEQEGGEGEREKFNAAEKKVR